MNKRIGIVGGEKNTVQYVSMFKVEGRVKKFQNRGMVDKKGD